MSIAKRRTTAMLAVGALALGLPAAAPSQAHHRDSDRWERRLGHHHGAWIYRTDRRLSWHRRWHRWHADNDGKTGTKHATGPSLRVESTAYCLTGYMANGQRAHTGAVAMNGVPLGTKFVITSGPMRGERVTVKDRIGHGSEFDVAMPNRCSSARRYGRRMVNIRRIT